MKRWPGYVVVRDTTDGLIAMPLSHEDYPLGDDEHIYVLVETPKKRKRRKARK